MGLTKDRIKIQMVGRYHYERNAETVGPRKEDLSTPQGQQLINQSSQPTPQSRNYGILLKIKLNSNGLVDLWNRVGIRNTDSNAQLKRR